MIAKLSSPGKDIPWRATWAPEIDSWPQPGTAPECCIYESVSGLAAGMGGFYKQLQIGVPFSPCGLSQSFQLSCSVSVRKEEDTVQPESCRKRANRQLKPFFRKKAKNREKGGTEQPSPIQGHVVTEFQSTELKL